MTKQEELLIEKIAKRISGMGFHSALDFAEEITTGTAFRLANQIHAIYKEAGYVKRNIAVLNKIAKGEDLPSVIGTTLDGQPLIKERK